MSGWNPMRQAFDPPPPYYVVILESGQWICPETGRYRITVQGGNGSTGAPGENKQVDLDAVAGASYPVEVGQVGGYVTIERGDAS